MGPGRARGPTEAPDPGRRDRRPGETGGLLNGAETGIRWKRGEEPELGCTFWGHGKQSLGGGSSAEMGSRQEGPKTTEGETSWGRAGARCASTCRRAGRAAQCSAAPRGRRGHGSQNEAGPLGARRSLRGAGPISRWHRGRVLPRGERASEAEAREDPTGSQPKCSQPPCFEAPGGPPGLLAL
ncbi:hypothetical protein NN561_013858 [Cricetulus griseus]